MVNEAATTKTLRISSPQSGLVTAGAADLSMTRQDQRHLKDGEIPGGAPGRFLQAEMVTAQPMTSNLSGLRVEYALALLYSSESGQREATIGFDVGQGTQDLGFRGEVPVLFDVRPAIPVKLRVRDHDGTPTVAHFTFVDRSGRVHPPQPKRTAPDLFFQRQVYRADGGVVLLPPGRITVTYGRGPEYRLQSREIDRPRAGRSDARRPPGALDRPGGPRLFQRRPPHPRRRLRHYTDPTQGVEPGGHVPPGQGRGLERRLRPDLGSVLRLPAPVLRAARPTGLSEPLTLIKYDVEVSGFGSQALGHVCLLEPPRPDLTRARTAPRPRAGRRWTTPVLRWAKAQGAVTGYAHSGSGLEINPKAAAERLLTALDKDADGSLTLAEAAGGLLPGEFAPADADRDGVLTRAELEAAHDRAAETLPNFAIPEMNGVGAMEVVVSVPEGVCDFISAMDTPRIAEWNMLVPPAQLRVPAQGQRRDRLPLHERACGSARGGVYVRLGDVKSLDFDAWCAGLAAGRSYVSDGFAHALEFTVGGKRPGDRLELEKPETVAVRAKVAFAARTPLAVAHGGIVPAGGRQARRRHRQPARTAARRRVHRAEASPAASSWWSTARRSPAATCRRTTGSTSWSSRPDRAE